jgi:phenylacetic acid degradation operon negative regulatory protein
VRWSLTPAARRLLNAGCARIASFGHNGGRWDGTWLVLLINVPEARREVRRTLRTRLAWAGFGSPEPGLWVCPNTAREADTRRILVELDLTAGARSFIARHGAIGAPESMAARAWNLAELDERYVRFVATFAAVTPADPTAVWTALTRLVHDWRRFPFADPDLPAALLPPNWTGTTAAALFHRRHAEWVQGAQARWTTLAAG